MPTNYELEIEAGSRIARAAGQLALQMRKGDIGTESKSDESPVTLADKACEKLIVEELTKAFPEDGLLGEEGASREPANGRKWIIDPIDGTRDFIRGTGAWSVLIGLEEKGEVVAGFAYFPVHDKLYWAAKGRGAYCENERIHAQDVSEKSQALLCVNGFSFLYRFPFAKDLVTWLSGFWAVRSMGGCLDSMLVSSGKADGWLEAQAKPWDLAPLQIIAEEAGCLTFDFTGERTIYGGNFIITVPGLAAEMKRFVGATK